MVQSFGILIDSIQYVRFKFEIDVHLLAHFFGYQFGSMVMPRTPVGITTQLSRSTATRSLINALLKSISDLMMYKN